MLVRINPFGDCAQERGTSRSIDRPQETELARIGLLFKVAAKRQAAQKEVNSSCRIGDTERGAALGSLTPLVIGALQDAGWALPNAMVLCIVTSLVIVIVMIWLGPETRGRDFRAVDLD